MLRVHFTGDDLARVVLGSSAVPELGEAVLSLQILRGTDERLRYGAWRRGLTAPVRQAARPLLELVPAQGWIPDFLTPVAPPAGDGSALLEAIRATPVRRIRAELGLLAATNPLPAWAHALALGDLDTLTAVTRALAAYQRAAITPHAPRIQALRDAELRRMATVLARYGVGALLGQVHPSVRWRPPVLTLPAPIDADVHLAGRGLALTPLLFCGPIPRLRIDSAGGGSGGDSDGDIPVLAYQMPFDAVDGNPLTPSRVPPQAAAALSRLLGGTRATALRTIADHPGVTTARLAELAGVAPASASEHATVLRQTGLVTSIRDGHRVRHYVTSTGMALLEPGPAT